jgi:hypothetical protein
MGGFMIAEVARLLHEKQNKTSFGLYTILTQEEVIFVVQKMITKTIKPNVVFN